MLSKHLKITLILFFCALLPLMAKDNSSYTFGVLSQRSAVLTAQYWNPILRYVSAKSGVLLILKVERTAPDSNLAVQKGSYDFVYDNVIFSPQMLKENYRVLLRPRDQAISGQIVTLADSPFYSLSDVSGKEMGFPSHTAFVGYSVPMDYLQKKGIHVIPVFGGNQEGIMAQLKAGKILVAAVNNKIMKAYAHRENLAYRVLWESEKFLNIPIAVHPRVSEEIVQAVQKAFMQMHSDPEGLQILEASAKLIFKDPPLGFLPSSSKEYQNYRDFYTQTVLEELK